MLRAFRISRRVLFLLALATTTTQILAWSVRGRHHLADCVSVAVRRDLSHFRELSRSYHPQAPWPPFQVLVVPPNTVSPNTSAALEHVLAANAIRLAPMSPPDDLAATAYVLSYEITFNTPLLGTIESSYSREGAGLSMRTRFLFAFGVWLPLSTTQRGMS